MDEENEKKKKQNFSQDVPFDFIDRKRATPTLNIKLYMPNLYATMDLDKCKFQMSIHLINSVCDN